jgi:LysR family nitrogen assimilation transcriptional regulator
MDLKQLDYFVHVAELGSFSKAASLLDTAQSALSHKVRQLEVELKQTLLHRNGRGVTPTEAGKRLLVHARGILMQVARTHDQLAELGESPSGHVTVGLPATMGKLLTLPLIRAFRAGFPNATVGIMEGLSASIVEWVSTGRVDIGMVFNPAPSPAIEITPVHEEPMYLVSRLPAHGARTLPLKELPNHPLIIPSRPNANRMRIEAQLAYFGLKPSIAFEVDGIASLLDMVREGYGSAVLPITSLRAYGLEKAFAARAIVSPRLLIQISLVISAQRPTIPLGKEALALIRRTAAEVLAVKPAERAAGR